MMPVEESHILPRRQSQERFSPKVLPWQTGSGPDESMAPTPSKELVTRSAFIHEIHETGNHLCVMAMLSKNRGGNVVGSATDTETRAGGIRRHGDGRVRRAELRGWTQALTPIFRSLLARVSVFSFEQHCDDRGRDMLPRPLWLTDVKRGEVPNGREPPGTSKTLLVHYLNRSRIDQREITPVPVVPIPLPEA